MATNPNDADAWEDLQSHAKTLDSITHPQPLRLEIQAHLSKRWDMSSSHLDMSDFGIVWIDPYYRPLANKLVSNGPCRQIFNMYMLRKLRNYRVEGHWSYFLESTADWVDAAAGNWKSRITIEDLEQVLDCLPKAHEVSKTYEHHLKALFWNGDAFMASTRAEHFLAALDISGYIKFYKYALAHRPNARWRLHQIVEEIAEQGPKAKVLMLHICLWFVPNLVEPGNRTLKKPPIYEHLKAVLSTSSPESSRFAAENTWRPRALAVQEAVLKYLSDHLLELQVGNSALKTEPLAWKSKGSYTPLMNSSVWRALAAEVREVAGVPFKHVDLVRFNDFAIDSPADRTSVSDVNTSGVDTLLGASAKAQSRTRRETVREAENNAHDTSSLEDVERVIDEFNDDTDEDMTEDDPELFVPQESLFEDSHKTAERLPISLMRKRKLVEVKEEFLGDSHYGHSLYGATSSKIIKLQIPTKNTSMANSSNTTSSSSTQNESIRPSKTGKRPETNFQEQIHRGEGLLQQNKTPSSTVITPSATQTIPRPNTRSTQVDQRATPLEYSSADNDISFLPQRRKRLHNLPAPSPAPSPDLVPIPIQPAVLLNEHSPVLPVNSPDFPQLYSQAHPQLQYQAQGPQTPIHSSPGHSTAPPPVLQSTPVEVARTKVEQAVLILQDQYMDKLQIKEMVSAINVVRHEVEASIFLSLRPGRLRNAWLYAEIKKP